MKNNWKEEMYEIITHNETSECHLKLVYLVESLLAEQKKELMEEIKKDLLYITKGIDDDGSEYAASQIDYIDIEDLFKRYD